MDRKSVQRRQPQKYLQSRFNERDNYQIRCFCDANWSFATNKKKEQLWNKIIYEIIVVLEKSCLKLSHIPYLLIEPFDIFQEA